MAKHKTFYGVGVLMGLSLSLIALLSLTAAAPNIGEAQSPTQTLDPEVVKTMNQLEELISDEECQLPCWWGWMLGEDDFEKIQADAQGYFGQTAIENWEGVKYSEGYAAVSKAFFNSPEDEIPYLVFLLWFKERDELFTAILLRIQPWLTSLDVSPYEPSSILETYGPPDEITLYVSFESYSYVLTFRYFSLGLYLKYYVDIAEDEKTSEGELLICPSALITSIDFWGLDKDLPESSLPYDYASSSIIRLPDEKDIDDVSNVDILGFVDQFTGDDKGCIKTVPIEWPNSSSGTEIPG